MACRHVGVKRRDLRSGLRFYACRECGLPLVAHSWWHKRLLPLTHVLILEVPSRYLDEARQYEGKLYPVDRLPEGFAISGSPNWDWWLTYRSDGTLDTACARNFFRQLPGGRWQRYPFWDTVSPEEAWQQYAGRRACRIDPGLLAQYMGREATEEDAYKMAEALRARGYDVRLVRGGTDRLPPIPEDEWLAIMDAALKA